MRKRVTVVRDEDVHKKLRQLQAKMIDVDRQHVSFSRVINDVMAKRLKK